MGSVWHLQIFLDLCEHSVLFTASFASLPMILSERNLLLMGRLCSPSTLKNRSASHIHSP